MFYDLEKDNHVLKEKENMLEREITKQEGAKILTLLRMNTKLQRISELMRKDRSMKDKDLSSLQTELDEHMSSLRAENFEIQDRVHKLKTITKTMEQNQMAPKAKAAPSKSKTATSSFKRPQSSSMRPTTSATYGGASQTGTQRLIEEMKQQVIENERSILRLQGDYDRVSAHSSGVATHDELVRRIQFKDKEIREVAGKFEDLERQFVNKENIFKESKGYMEEVMKEVREYRTKVEQVKSQNMKLHIQAGSASDMSNQLSMIQSERDHIEGAIRRLTTEPFFKRETGQSMTKRMAELEDKLKFKEDMLRKLSEEENKKIEDASQLKTNLEKLRGERDYLEGENSKLRGKFSDTNQLQEFNVYKSLFKMDPAKYAQTMTDLTMGNNEAYPAWSQMEFLDRPEERVDPSNIQQLRAEVRKLQHENKDFAAELEKAQNLLKLQRDIENDNLHYFEAEKKRIELIYKSSQMKGEELARRADEKQRTIMQAQSKLGLRTSSPSPMKDQTLARGSFGAIQDFETQSEFSVVTNESDIRADENILDLAVESAEYNYNAFSSVLDAQELALHQRTLITFATVDFFNHDTETSQIAEGYKPVYKTQFSFKNKVDEFFVQFLQKQTIKVDVYISKNNAAIHLGHAEIHLREIVERETAIQDIAQRTPVTEKHLTVYAARGNPNIVVGQIHVKLRMRKPITEAMRFFREKNDIQQMTVTAQTQSSFQRKKLVTIQVIGCQNLTAKHSDLTKIAPFFYYQFYTFDEKYSKTSVGAEPAFDDTQTYEVNFDARGIGYMEKESLELIFFDDNAPLGGVERGGRGAEGENEDMIGTARVPLADLIKGACIHDRFPIRNSKRENCGTVEVKLTVMDLDGHLTGAGLGSAVNLAYNQQWEDDIVYRIALKLAKFPVGESIELLFGIFTSGSKTVDRETFKMVIRRKLQLKDEISEKELDIFLKGNPYLADKEYIDLADFMQIFSAAITKARMDLQNTEAMQYSTIQKADQLRQSRENYSPGKEYSSTSAFQEGQVMEFLQKVRKYGNLEQLREKIRLYQDSHDQIRSGDLLAGLSNEGGLSDAEARKVVQFIEYNGSVSVPKFYQLLDKALSASMISSAAVDHFHREIQVHGDSLAIKLQEQDYNKDGALNQDGVKAALLHTEFGFKVPEATEVFQLLNRGGMFYYREYLCQKNPGLRRLFADRASTPSIPTQRLDQESMSMSLSSAIPTLAPNDPQLQLIKNKIREYIIKQDISLNILFTLMDTDGNRNLDFSEFKSKMASLKLPVDDDELKILFKSIDRDGSGSITYKEFAQEFSKINCEMLIGRIKKIITGAKVPPEAIFDKHCSDRKSNQLIKSDFTRLVRTYVEKSTDHEIATLFRHFDQSGKGYIKREEFTQAFGREIKEQIFKVSIEDIIKPLITKIREFKINPAELFDRYDQNKNGTLSAEELAVAIKKDLKTQLSDEEVLIMKQYFVDKTRRVEIMKSAWIDLVNTKFENVVDQGSARESLSSLKKKFSTGNDSAANVLRAYQIESTQQVTIRNFKVAVNNLHVLSQFEIDNLAKHMDNNGQGFISIPEFDAAVRGALLRQTTGTKRAEHWNKSSTMRSSKGGF